MSNASIYEGQTSLIPVVNALGNVFEEWQIATAAQTIFNIVSFQYTPGTNTLLVFKNGIFLRRGFDFTESSSSQIILSSGATLNDRIAFFAWATEGVAIPNGGGVPAGGVTGQALIKTSNNDYATSWQSLSALASLLDAPKANVAAANTINLAAISATTRNIAINGTTTIAGFQIANGQLWAVTFNQACTLAYSASLITQTIEDINVVPGSSCFIRAIADNVVEILSYVAPYNPANSFKNKLINPKLLINQRGYISGSAVGAGTYTYDRWRIVFAGQSLVTSVIGNALRCAPPSSGVEQIIEGSNIEGGLYSLSWIGDASATVNGNPILSGGTIVLPANIDVSIKFFNGTMLKPQFERGRSTVFEERPDAIETLLCQRYFYSFNGTSTYGMGQAYSTTALAWVVHFPVTMRINPTATFNSITVTNAALAAATATTAAISNGGTKTVAVGITIAAPTFVAGNVSIISGNSAGSYAFFSAEL